MLEYGPRAELVSALAGLRARLAPGGRLLLIVTRASFVPTRWLWHCDAFTRARLRSALAAAGYGTVRFPGYPPSAWWLNVGNHVAGAALPGPDSGPGAGSGMAAARGSCVSSRGNRPGSGVPANQPSS